MPLAKTLYTRVAQLSVIIPITIGFIHYKKLSQPFRILLYLLVFMAICDVTSTVAGRIFSNNRPIQHIGTYLQFLAFSVIYGQFFWKNRAMRLFIGFSVAAGTLVAIADIYIHGILEVNTLARPYFSISIVCYTLAFFYHLFKDTSSHTWEQPMFWVSIGAMFYFGCNTLYFILTDYLMSKTIFTSVVGLIAHNVFNIVANLLYAQSFRCFRKQKAAL